MSDKPECPSRDSTTCRIWLIRHGESLFNAEKAATGKAPVEPKFIDAPLSSIGVSQAEHLRDGHWPQHFSPDLVVVSPLSRALQTYTVALERFSHVPVIITRLHSEYMRAVCDIGSSGTVLAQRFPALSDQLKQLDDDWFLQNDPQMLERCGGGGADTPNNTVTTAATDTAVTRIARRAREQFSQGWEGESEDTFERRIDVFATWLREKSQTLSQCNGHGNPNDEENSSVAEKSCNNIVVIGHADAFHRLTGHRVANTKNFKSCADDNKDGDNDGDDDLDDGRDEVFGQWLDNCQVYEFDGLFDREPLAHMRV